MELKLLRRKKLNIAKKCDDLVKLEFLNKLQIYLSAHLHTTNGVSRPLISLTRLILLALAGELAKVLNFKYFRKS